MFRGYVQLQEHLRREKKRKERELEAGTQKSESKKPCHAASPCTHPTPEPSKAQYIQDHIDRLNLQSPGAKEAIQPFIRSMDWPTVKQVTNDLPQMDALDGTTPIHWCTGNEVYDKSEIMAQVLHDMGCNPISTFPSGHMVDTALPPKKGISGIARVMSYMIHPNPDCPSLMYAVNISGTSTAPFYVPGLLHRARHFDEAEVGRYNSNITPQGTLVDLHHGKFTTGLLKHI
jgi:hypothetical protein